MANNSETVDPFQLGIISILPYTVCTFGVVSHVLLIIAFIKDPLKCFRNSGTYLMENLAVSDLMTCIFAPFIYFQGSTYLVLQIIGSVAIIVSIFTIASISLDRFLLVVYPMKHRVLMKGKVILVWSAFIWLVGLVTPLKTLLLSTNGTEDLEIMVIFATATPTISGILYGIIHYKLRKQSNNLALENLSNRQQHARNIKEKRFLRTVILIACIAFVCIVPPTIFYRYAVFGKRFADAGMAARILMVIFYAVYFLNFAVNPLVYVLRLPNYRKTFYLLYCKKNA
jgi:hypothetical protein